MTDVRRQPTFSQQRVTSILNRAYGIQSKLAELPSERDQNFLVQATDHSKYVFKISNPFEQIETLRFQNEALEKIVDYDPDLLVPRVVRALSGDEVVKIRDAAGSSHFARLMTHLDGRTLASEMDISPILSLKVGRFLGRVDNALAGYWHPASKRDLKWSVFQAIEVINDSLHYISEPDKRAIVEYFLSTFESHVFSNLWQLPLGVIHNDANDHNILVSSKSDEHNQITGRKKGKV